MHCRILHCCIYTWPNSPLSIGAHWLRHPLPSGLSRPLANQPRLQQCTTDDVIMDGTQRPMAAAEAAAAAAALRARLAAVVASPAAVPALAALDERAAAAAELAASRSGALGASSCVTQLPTPVNNSGVLGTPGSGSGVLGASASRASVAIPRPSTVSTLGPASGRRPTITTPPLVPVNVTLLHVASALIAALVPMRRHEGAMWAAAFLERTLRGFQLTSQGSLLIPAVETPYGGD